MQQRTEALIHMVDLWQDWTDQMNHILRLVIRQYKT